MNMPGFDAEASVYKTIEGYRFVGALDGPAGYSSTSEANSVLPAAFCEECECHFFCSTARKNAQLFL